MPFPRPTFITELADYPEVLLELDQYSALNAQWASREHHGDGRHKGITADSVEVRGDLTVLGFTAFEDLSGNAIIANEIAVDLLEVQGALTWATSMVSAAVDVASSPIWDFTGSSPVLKIRHPSGTDAPIFLFNTGGLSLGNSGAAFAVDFDVFGNAFISGDLEVDSTTLVVDATNNRVGIGTASPSVALDVVGQISTDTAVVISKANASDSLQVTSSTAANAAYQAFRNNSGQRAFVGRDNSGGTAIGTGGRAFALSIWQESNHGIQFGSNNTEVGYWDTTIFKVDGSTFNVDATNNRVGIGTASPAVQFHVTSAMRLAWLANDVLTVDGSGNVIAGGFPTADVGYTDDLGATKTMHFVSGMFNGTT